MQSAIIGANTTTYDYNADGLTSARRAPTYVWDGSQLVMELDGSKNVVSKYIRGNDLVKSEDVKEH